MLIIILPVRNPLRIDNNNNNKVAQPPTPLSNHNDKITNANLHNKIDNNTNRNTNDDTHTN